MLARVVSRDVNIRVAIPRVPGRPVSGERGRGEEEISDMEFRGSTSMSWHVAYRASVKCRPQDGRPGGRAGPAHPGETRLADVPFPLVLGYVPFAVAVPNTAWYIVPLRFHFSSFARMDVAGRCVYLRITQSRCLLPGSSFCEKVGFNQRRILSWETFLFGFIFPVVLYLKKEINVVKHE